MDRRYRGPGVRVALVGLAALVLVAGAGTNLAAGSELPARTAELVESGLLAKGAGYGGTRQAARARAWQRRPPPAGLRRGPLDRRLDRRTEMAVATTALEPLGAQAPQGMALSSVVPRAPAGARTVGLMPAVGFTAMALLLGALCGALVDRVNPTQGTVGPAGLEQDPAEGLAESGKRAHPQPHISPVTASGQGGSLRVMGYVSVPEVTGDDVAAVAQADAIQRLCEQRGWELLRVVRDVENGRTKGLERPGLLYALDRIADGEASCLVVSHLERLTRSAADLGRIVEWFEQYQGRLVAIDLRLDTGSAEGRLTARTLVAVGGWEGRRIADQTKKGLAAARARRATTGPPTLDDRPGLKEYIVTLRNQGMTLQAIADRLNAEGIPTLRGGTKWRPSSVHGAVGYRRPNTKHPIGKGQRHERQG